MSSTSLWFSLIHTVLLEGEGGGVNAALSKPYDVVIHSFVSIPERKTKSEKGGVLISDSEVISKVKTDSR